jgi:uncharacterized Zn-binding protein involved in type VI secretion
VHQRHDRHDAGGERRQHVLCVGPPDTIVKGSMTVARRWTSAARMGDMTAHGEHHSWRADVMIGG